MNKGVLPINFAECELEHFVSRARLGPLPKTRKWSRSSNCFAQSANSTSGRPPAEASVLSVPAGLLRNWGRVGALEGRFVSVGRRGPDHYYRATKRHEFSHVFIPGLVEGIVPRDVPADELARETARLSVAMTRAELPVRDADRQ